METITREDLRKMNANSIVRKNEERIKFYVDYIKETIIKRSEEGDVFCVYNFDKKAKNESDELIQEVITRLQKIFVDMDIVYHKADGQRSEASQLLSSKVAKLPENFGQGAESLQQLTLKGALHPEEFGKSDTHITFDWSGG